MKAKKGGSSTVPLSLPPSSGELLSPQGDKRREKGIAYLG